MRCFRAAFSAQSLGAGHGQQVLAPPAKRAASVRADAGTSVRRAACRERSRNHLREASSGPYLAAGTTTTIRSDEPSTHHPRPLPSRSSSVAPGAGPTRNEVTEGSFLGDASVTRGADAGLAHACVQAEVADQALGRSEAADGRRSLRSASPRLVTSRTSSWIDRLARLVSPPVQPPPAASSPVGILLHRETFSGTDGPIGPCILKNVRSASYDHAWEPSCICGLRVRPSQCSFHRPRGTLLARRRSEPHRSWGPRGAPVPPNGVVIVTTEEKVHFDDVVVGRLSLKMDLLVRGLIMASQGRWMRGTRDRSSSSSQPL